MILRKNKGGQSSLEYVILLTLIMAAFLGVSNYFKRGVQGRWKAAVDDLGDQYDPRVANTSIRHAITSSVVTTIQKVDLGGNVFVTTRSDMSNSVETKQGFEGVVGY